MSKFRCDACKQDREYVDSVVYLRKINNEWHSDECAYCYCERVGRRKPVNYERVYPPCLPPKEDVIEVAFSRPSPPG